MSTASVQADKVVNVRMSESEHMVEGLCASLIGHARVREFRLMEYRLLLLPARALLDGRARNRARPQGQQALFGYACYYCQHSEACTAGGELLYIPRQEIRELVAEESAYIFDFDGSSIEAPAQVG